MVKIYLRDPPSSTSFLDTQSTHSFTKMMRLSFILFVAATATSALSIYPRQSASLSFPGALILLILLLLLTLGILACSFPCLVGANTDGCAATDNACMCMSQAFLDSTTACIVQSCTDPTDLATAEGTSVALCKMAVGSGFVTTFLLTDADVLDSRASISLAVLPLLFLPQPEHGTFKDHPYQPLLQPTSD